MRFFSYLLRHRKNDDSPYEAGGAVLGIAFLAVGAFAFAAGNAYLLTSGSLASVIASTLVDLTNDDRQAYALAPLRVSPVLTAVAQAKADDMAARSYFSHISPEGHDPWYWFAQKGYSYRYAGENLAVDFTDSAMVENAWMASPGHRANLLDGRFTEVGIAVAKGTFEGREAIFVAQAFGTPSSAPAAPEEVAVVPAEPTAPAIAVATVAARPAVAGAQPGATTSAPLAAATAEQASPTVSSVAAPSPAPWWARLLASPKAMLGYAYWVLAGLTLLLFAYVTELELRKRHLRHALEACALLLLMGALSLIADALFFTHPVLAAL